MEAGQLRVPSGNRAQVVDATPAVEICDGQACPWPRRSTRRQDDAGERPHYPQGPDLTSRMPPQPRPSTAPAMERLAGAG